MDCAYFCTVAISWCLCHHCAAICSLLRMVSCIRNGERVAYPVKIYPMAALTSASPWWAKWLGFPVYLSVHLLLTDSILVSHYNCCMFLYHFHMHSTGSSQGIPILLRRSLLVTDWLSSLFDTLVSLLVTFLTEGPIANVTKNMSSNKWPFNSGIFLLSSWMI